MHTYRSIVPGDDKSIANRFKMLGLYLYTLMIGHKSCNMLSILNKLKFQKKLQNIVKK